MTHTMLEATVDIETPEHVAFSYTLAGAGSRVLAALIDYAICFVLLVATLIISMLVGSPGSVARAATAWGSAILIIVQFAVIWGYYVLFEGLNDGQTPGKRWLGLRVVQDGGYSVTFAASAVRNLARAIDQQPVFLYAVGLVGVVVSRSHKRVGDMLAATIVVRERVVRVPASASEERPGDTAPLHTLLTDDEYAVLTRYVERRHTLEPAQRERLTAQLTARFRDRAQDPDAGDVQMLTALQQREAAARARGVAARSDTGAAREQHALVAAGSKKWAAFAATLAEVQRRGLGRLPESQVSGFVAQYRELSADLARLQTASRGREVDAVFYLSRLVAAAHNLIYRQRSLSARAVLEFMTGAVPAEIRRSWRPIALAVVFLFAPLAITWVAVTRDPAVASTFIPPSMIERAELGVQRAASGEGYIPDPQLMRPVLASRIVANNVQVTFAAFAFGVTAGLGTLLLLVFNGVSIGGVLGLYQSKGILSLIVAFVAPHSVLELGAICIAGGAGFLLGAALLIPGQRTRREALVENGRRSIRLIAASTLMLFIAGAVEGFISPIPWWPLLWKASVTAVSAVFFFGFVFLRGPTARPAP
jgi:uncharacterized membrane protein SpoIIM required for sporulation/uncharacterized RDD family membrane protein YckC